MFISMFIFRVQLSFYRNYNFIIYSQSTLDWDKNNLFLRFPIFIFDNENFLFSAVFVNLQVFL